MKFTPNLTSRNSKTYLTPSYGLIIEKKNELGPQFLRVDNWKKKRTWPPILTGWKLKNEVGPQFLPLLLKNFHDLRDNIGRIRPDNPNHRHLNTKYYYTVLSNTKNLYKQTNLKTKILPMTALPRPSNQRKWLKIGGAGPENKNID